MSIVYCKKTRRQFLLGSGKSLLALPLLPSLLPREAWAAPAPRRTMLFWFDHNNLFEMWPARSAATTAVGSSGARQVALRSIANVTASTSVLSNARYTSLKNADQLTILRGFDNSVEEGGHGNYALACGEGRESNGNYPTLDTVMEASTTLYPTGTPISTQKAIRINLEGSVFYQKVGSSPQVLPQYGYNDPSTTSDRTILTFYNDVFGSLTQGTVPPSDLTNQLKSNILNRVHESFRTFRNGRRISAEDRTRLDVHMGYISDLQRSLATVTPQPTVTCTRPSTPSNTSAGNEVQYVGMYAELLAIAFKCGLTKFGVFRFDPNSQWIPGMDLSGNSLHDCMHGAHGAVLQRRAYESWWRFHANIIADRFLAPLEEMESDTGRSYLDNMITGMICSGGLHGLNDGDGGHRGWDSQQILIGSMGGRMRSGQFMSMPSGPGRNLPDNCFILTILQLMGVPASEYAFATANGQGFGYYGHHGTNHPNRDRFYQPITELLV